MADNEAEVQAPIVNINQRRPREDGISMQLYQASEQLNLVLEKITGVVRTRSAEVKKISRLVDEIERTVAALKECL